MRHVRLFVMMFAALAAFAQDNAAADKKKDEKVPEISQADNMAYLGAYVAVTNAEKQVAEAQKTLSEISQRITQICGGNRLVNLDVKTGKVTCGDLVPGQTTPVAAPVDDKKKKK